MLQFFFKYKNSFLASIVTVIIAISMLGFGVQLFDGSTKQEQFAAKVDETEISTVEFYRAKRNLEARYQQMLGANYSQFADSLLAGINQNVIDGLIDQELLDRVVAQVGLRVDDSQIAKEIRDNLFPKGYSAAAFASFLRQEGLTAVSFQEDLRRDLSRGALRKLIEDFSAPTPEEVKAAIRIAKAVRTVDYVRVDSSGATAEVPAPSEEELSRIFERETANLTEQKKVGFSYFEVSAEAFPGLVPVEQDEIDLYYTDHLQQFTEPTQVNVRHILLTNNVVEPVKGKDSPKQGDKMARAAEVLRELGAGLDFTKAAEKFSEDLATKAKGGELGWLDANSADKELADKVLALKTSVTPVQISTSKGEHIVEVVDRREERVKPLEEVAVSIRAQIEKEALPSFLAAKADELTADWKKSELGLKDYLAKVGLAPEVVAKVGASAGAVPVGQDPAPNLGGLTTAVMDRRLEGKFHLDLRDSPLLIEVTEYVEERQPDLAEVRDRLIAIYKRGEELKRTESRASEILTKVKGDPSTLATIAKEQGLSLLTAKEDVTSKITDPDLAGQLASVDSAPQAAEVLGKDGDGWIVAVVRAVDYPSDKDIESQVTQFTSQLKQQNAELFLQSILAQSKAGANVEVSNAL